MDIKKLQKIVVGALEDVKAQDIRLYNTEHLTSMFDRIAIASGTSSRQTKALASSVRDKVKESGGKIVSIEGENTGEWVLVDLGDMVVHIMQPTIRAYYHLEEIWGGKPVSLTTTKRAAKPSVASAPKKSAAKKSAPKKTAAAKTAKTVSDESAAAKPRSPRKTATKTTTKKTSAPKKTASVAASPKPSRGKSKGA